MYGCLSAACARALPSLAWRRCARARATFWPTICAVMVTPATCWRRRHWRVNAHCLSPQHARAYRRARARYEEGEYALALRARARANGARCGCACCCAYMAPTTTMTRGAWHAYAVSRCLTLLQHVYDLVGNQRKQHYCQPARWHCFSLSYYRIYSVVSIGDDDVGGVMMMKLLSVRN